MTNWRFKFFYLATTVFVLTVLTLYISDFPDEHIFYMLAPFIISASSIIGAISGCFCLDEIEKLKRYGILTKVFATSCIVLLTFIEAGTAVITIIAATLFGRILFAS